MKQFVIFKQLWFTFILIFLGIFSIHAQNNSVSFKHITAKNGLSQNGVMAIYKDSKGYIWIGTRDGLNRYDGYSFKIFRHDDLNDNSISNNFVNVITEDDQGVIWIGTNNGLNAYNRTTGQFTVYKNRSADNTTISDNKILSMLRTSEGLWIGTENGLNLRSNTSNSFEQFHNTIHNENSLSDNQIWALFEDSNRNLWIGTANGGLNKKDKKSNSFTRYTHKKQNAVISNFIRSIAEDADQNIWIGTSADGISILDQKGNFSHITSDPKSKNTLSNNRIKTLSFDKDFNLWIGTYDGLNFYNTSTKTFEIFKNIDGNTNTLSQNSIRSLLIDNNGFLWAGTYFGGLNLLNLNSKQFTHYHHNPTNENSLSYNIVSAMVEDKQQNVWIGTEGGGLNYFDFKKQSFSRIEKFAGKVLDHKTIKSLLIDSKENLWVGTHLNGLSFLNLNTGKFQEFRVNHLDENGLIDNSVISLLEDRSGKIWIGTENGLNLYDPKNKKINRVTIKDNNEPITSLFEDSKNNVWVGTKTKGLFLFEKGTINHFIHDKMNPTSLSHNSIYDVFEDSTGQIWIGTYGGGLNLFNPTNETFSNFKTRDGLVNNIVYDIMEDTEHNLWISTPSGISKYKLGSNTFKNYTTNNGLPIDEFNSKSSLKHSSGNFYFGGFNGLVRFNPKEIKDNFVAPEISLTELKLRNQLVIPNDNTNLLKYSLDETKVVTFNHDQRIFSINFVALNYAQLGQNQYAYMLEGLESDWNYVGNKRSATYTNLSSGNYTFKVKAANNDGIWSEEIASLKIIKLAPYWQTGWAYFIYFLLGILFFLLGRKYFLLKLNLENELKLEQLEKQQLEDLTQLKLKFFTNISHDFRTPLTLIHGPLQQLISRSETKEEHGHLILIKKNVNLMLRLINQLMDFRKMQTSKLKLKLIKEPIVPFIKETLYSFQELAKSHDIKFLFISRVSNKNIYFDKDKLEKILYNLLSNAFKYTPDGGKITIEIYTKYDQETKEKTFIEMSVVNSGKGIKKKDLENIFDRFYQGKNETEYAESGSGVGLALVKNLIELHQGYITADSVLDSHTEFVVGIPLSDVYEEEDKVEVEPTELVERQSEIGKSSAPKKESSTKKEYTILVVEDNKDLRQFLSETLSSDYNILTAENGEVGLEIIKEHKPNLVISDIMMPKMNGLEMCKAIKEDSKTKHIPIILLTARTATSVELDSYGSGANDFISKPFNIDVLKSKVQNLITSMDSLKNYSRKEVLLEDTEINNSTADEKFLKKLSNYIRDHIDDVDLNVNKTSEDLGISRVHLYRKTKAITGQTPVEFIRNFRLTVAANLIDQENYNVNEISYNVGFQDVSYFRKMFKKKFNISATQYAKREKNTQLN